MRSRKKARSRDDNPNTLPGCGNYINAMDDGHFLATVVPTTPLEIECIARIDRLVSNAAEELERAEMLLEVAERNLGETKEELAEAEKERDAHWGDLQVAEDRIEDLEIACREMFEAYDEFTNLRNLLKGETK